MLVASTEQTAKVADTTSPNLTGERPAGWSGETGWQRKNDLSLVEWRERLQLGENGEGWGKASWTRQRLDARTTKTGLTAFSLGIYVVARMRAFWQHWSAACSGPIPPQPVREELDLPRGPINTQLLLGYRLFWHYPVLYCVSTLQCALGVWVRNAS